MPLVVAAGAATLMSRGTAAGRREDLERLCPHLMTSPGWLSLGKAAGAWMRLLSELPEPRVRTGWFAESLLTELVIALVVRTRRPFFRSRPGTLLLASTLGVMAVTFVIPFLPFTSALGFMALPGTVLLAPMGMLFVAATELVKARFYRGVP